MSNSKAGTRKLRLQKALVLLECLIQLLSKSFMGRLGKHAEFSNRMGTVVQKSLMLDMENKEDCTKYIKLQFCAQLNETHAKNRYSKET